MQLSIQFSDEQEDTILYNITNFFIIVLEKKIDKYMYASMHVQEYWVWFRFLYIMNEK